MLLQNIPNAEQQHRFSLLAGVRLQQGLWQGNPLFKEERGRETVQDADRQENKNG